MNRARAAALTGFAAASLAALAAQYARSTDNPLFEPANFFSFFTVQSNLLSVAVFAALAARLWHDRGSDGRLDLARGAVALYMTTTCIVYALLLKETATQDQFQVAWSDKVIHLVMPLAVLGDFLVCRPSRAVAARAALLWLAFPIAWLAYTLVRGPIAEWYPYPFLDPARDGSAAVVAYSAAIAAFMAALAMALRALANRGRAAA